MKKIAFFIPLLLLFWKIDAQTGVCYDYDAAGNRIFRHDCISMLVSEEQQYSDQRSIGKIETAQVQGELIVFPNPTDGKIFVESLDVDFESGGVFEIVNEIGKVHFSKSIFATTKTIEIDVNLASGIYFLKYQNEDGLFTKKIIVQ